MISEDQYILLFLKNLVQTNEDHRTISLMPHAMKLLLKIIQRRIRSKLEIEIAEEQFGFSNGIGTRDGFFAIQALCERTKEMQKEVYVCFIMKKRSIKCSTRK